MGRVVLILTLSLNLLGACGQRSDTTTVVDQKAESNAQDAQSLSMDWLDEAKLHTTDTDLHDTIVEIQEILQERNLVSPPDAYAASCSPVSGNFVPAFVTGNFRNSDIYICPGSDRFGKVFMAQVLIHEALHLSGIRDECEVTRLEVQIMTDAFRIPYRNGYASECGIN